MAPKTSLTSLNACNVVQRTMTDPTSSDGAGPSRPTVVLSSEPEAPVQILTRNEVVEEWLQTPGFRGFWGWVQHRCDRVKGKSVMRGSYEGSSNVRRTLSAG